jgi:hypothetical protein
VAALALVAALTAGSGASRAAEPAKPKARDISSAYELAEQTAFRPAARALDLARWARRFGNNPREAANVDENDQVRLPSTWWQPRMGFRPVTVAQLMHGPGPGRGPAPGPWTITSAKNTGVTPGFQMKDSRGDKFIVKFDPPGFPEMATGADAIGCYLFWGAGYNVPENTIETFRRQDLRIDPEATYRDSRGREHPITPTYLNALLQRVARRPDGTYRCVASRSAPSNSPGGARTIRRTWCRTSCAANCAVCGRSRRG